MEVLEHQGAASLTVTAKSSWRRHFFSMFLKKPKYKNIFLLTKKRCLHSQNHKTQLNKIANHPNKQPPQLNTHSYAIKPVLPPQKPIRPVHNPTLEMFDTAAT